MRISFRNLLIALLFSASSFSGFFIFGQIHLGFISLAMIFAVILISNFFFFPKLTVTKIFIFLICLFIFFINYYKASFGGVEMAVWFARSSWILLLVIFILVDDNWSFLKNENLVNALLIIGLSQVIFILFAAITNNFEGRATSLLDSSVYSPVILFPIYYFSKKGSYGTIISFIIVLIILLTGSRFLILSAIILLIPLLKRSFFLSLISCILIYFYFDFTLLYERFSGAINFQRDFSYLGKISEIKIMFDFFLENPLIGKGIGVSYYNGIDILRFNYTHNMPMFLLGYTGLFGFIPFCYLIFQSLAIRSKRLLLFSFMVFTLSTTSYTFPATSLLLLYLIRNESY